MSKDERRPPRTRCEVVLLVVCATVCDCDDYDAIADWGEANLAVLRRYLPFYHGVPSGRWLTLLMNRIDPDLPVRCWPARARGAPTSGRAPARR